MGESAGWGRIVRTAAWTAYYPAEVVLRILSSASRSSVAPSLALIAFLVAWHARVVGSLDAGVALFYSVLLATSVMAGRVVAHRFAAAGVTSASDFPTTLLTGWLLLHVGLLALVSLPIPSTLAAVLMVAATCFAFIRARAWRKLVEPSPGWSTAAIFVSLLAATFWSEATLDPVLTNGEAIIFRPWSDSFYHSSWVSAFAQARGIWSIEHNLWIGAGTELYSFGDYLLPSTLVSLTNTSAYQATNCLWTPFGLFLTGVAAFAMVRRWWSARAAFGATVAVLCVPDASSYCMQNEYLGYYWLNLISNGGAWGTASAALAVIQVGTWCRSGDRLAAGLTLAAVGMTFLFKVQICMALIPLLIVMAIAGRRQWSRRRRALLFAGLAAIVGSSPWLADAMLPGQGLRLDGSGAKPYLMTLAQNQQGALRWLADRFTPDSSYVADVAAGVPFLLLSTFGPVLLTLVCVGLLLRQRAEPRTERAEANLVVTAAVTIYVAVTLGLSANTTGKHTVDALVHRPFVWAYFVVAAWSGGFVVASLGRCQWVRRHAIWARTSSAVLVATLLAFAYIAGQGALGPAWSAKYSNQDVPRALVECAEQLRKQSPEDSVVQDSRQDPMLVLVALSERRCYLTTSELVAGALEDREHRLARLAALRTAADVVSIEAIAAELGIDYFLLHPGDTVAWPPELLARPWHREGGHAVYRLR